MKATLRHLISPDIDENVYWPDEEDNFGFFVQALVGPEGEEGEEAFGFQVCTPKWISTKMINRDFDDFGVFGKHMIIVKNYDFEKIRGMIANLCNKTSGGNWSEIANKLCKYGEWEFDDYKIT